MRFSPVHGRRFATLRVENLEDRRVLSNLGAPELPVITQVTDADILVKKQQQPEVAIFFLTERLLGRSPSLANDTRGDSAQARQANQIENKWNEPRSNDHGAAQSAAK